MTKLLIADIITAIDEKKKKEDAGVNKRRDFVLKNSFYIKSHIT